MLNNKVITSILAFKKDVCNPEDNDLEKNIGALRSILDEFGIACPEDVAKGLCTMPASRKYHGNYEGGLFAHSLNVALALASLTDNLALEWQKDRSPILVGLFHDLCKIDLYEMSEDGYVYAGIWAHSTIRRIGSCTTQPLQSMPMCSLRTLRI